jgi:hypothetical protein
MRAQTITTKFSRRRISATGQIGAIAILVALAMPGAVVAAPGAQPTEEQLFPGMAREAREATEATQPTEQQAFPGLARDAHEAAADQPATTLAGTGFDWASAAVGAGAVLALSALGAAALLMVRRRTAASPAA